MASRLKIELWVRMRTKQAMNRQPWKLAQKPMLEESLERVLFKITIL